MIRSLQAFVRFAEKIDGIWDLFNSRDKEREGSLGGHAKCFKPIAVGDVESIAKLRRVAYYFFEMERKLKEDAKSSGRDWNVHKNWFSAVTMNVAQNIFQGLASLVVYQQRTCPSIPTTTCLNTTDPGEGHFRNMKGFAQKTLNGLNVFLMNAQAQRFNHLRMLDLINRGWYARASDPLEDDTGNSQPEDRVCNRREFAVGDSVQAHRRCGDLWTAAVVRDHTASGYSVCFSAESIPVALREYLIRRVPERRIVHTTLKARKAEFGIVHYRLPMSLLAAFP